MNKKVFQRLFLYHKKSLTSSSSSITEERKSQEDSDFELSSLNPQYNVCLCKFGVSLNHLLSLPILGTTKIKQARHILSTSSLCYAKYLQESSTTKHFVNDNVDVYVCLSWESSWAEVLRSLREYSGKREDLFLWIDFLCLDPVLKLDLNEFQSLSRRSPKRLLFLTFPINLQQD